MATEPLAKPRTAARNCRPPNRKSPFFFGFGGSQFLATVCWRGFTRGSIGAFEAKTHLSELLEKVRLCITRRGQPVAELRPGSASERRPRFGCDRNRVTIRKDFAAPLPDMKEYPL